MNHEITVFEFCLFVNAYYTYYKVICSRWIESWPPPTRRYVATVSQGLRAGSYVKVGCIKLRIIIIFTSPLAAATYLIYTLFVENTFSYTSLFMNLNLLYLRTHTKYNNIIIMVRLGKPKLHKWIKQLVNHAMHCTYDTSCFYTFFTDFDLWFTGDRKL